MAKAAKKTRKKRPGDKRSRILCLTFGRVLTRLRKGRKLSVEVLSQKSGVAVSRIARFEKGADEPNMADIFQLATALGVLPSQMTKSVERATG